MLFSAENLPAGLCRVQVHSHDLFDFAAVSTSQNPCDGDFFGLGEFKDHSVPHLKILMCELKRGVGIVSQRVGAGLVEQDVRLTVLKEPGKMAIHCFE